MFVFIRISRILLVTRLLRVLASPCTMYHSNPSYCVCGGCSLSHCIMSWSRVSNSPLASLLRAWNVAS